MARSIATWLNVALLCASAGCATHMTAVRPLSPEGEAQFNGLVAGREAKLTLKGEAFDSKDVRITGNTVRFVGREPGNPEWLPETEAPVTSLQRIEYSHGRNVLPGFVAGAVVGGLFGALVGTLSGTCYAWNTSGCVDQRAEKAVLGGLVGAGVVGLLGALVGAAGSRTIISFEDAPSR